MKYRIWKLVQETDDDEFVDMYLQDNPDDHLIVEDTEE